MRDHGKKLTTSIRLARVRARRARETYPLIGASAHVRTRQHWAAIYSEHRSAARRLRAHARQAIFDLRAEAGSLKDLGSVLADAELAIGEEGATCETCGARDAISHGGQYLCADCADIEGLMPG